MKKILFLFVMFPILMLSQQSVKGTFSPASNFTYAFLYKASPTTLSYLDRDKIAEDGSFNIQLDSTMTAGMYKIVYGVPQEENNFDFIYNGKEDVAFTFSLDEGLEFKESNENKLWASYTNSMEMINSTISNYYSQESSDKTAFNEIFKTLKDTQDAFEGASTGTLAATFIKANRPYIPAEYEDITTYSNHLKTSFLNIDFGNSLLQSSEFLNDRVMAYMFGMSATSTNVEYKQHVDEIVTAIGAENPAIKTALLENVWNKLIEMQNTGVANYISDTHLMILANKTGNNDLYQKLISYKNSSVGTIAQDFPITYEIDNKPVNTTLYDLSGADHYLLIFWSSTCGHCLNELPMVKNYIDTHPKNLKTIAFGIESEKENWQKTIPQFGGFIHVIGLNQWNNPIVKAYGVQSTPTYFILDKDKKFIAKPKDLEELKSALENL